MSTDSSVVFTLAVLHITLRQTKFVVWITCLAVVILVIVSDKGILIVIICIVSSKVPHLEEGAVLAVASGDTEASVEHDLPHARNASEKVASNTAVSRIPHLERPIAAGEDLVFIVLEASDSAGMAGESVEKFAGIGFPDSKGRVRRG